MLKIDIRALGGRRSETSVIKTVSVSKIVNENDVLSPDSTGRRKTRILVKLIHTIGRTTFSKGNRYSRFSAKEKSNLLLTFIAAIPIVILPSDTASLLGLIIHS